MNYWITRRGKRVVSKQINGHLAKFLGRSIDPLDELFTAMKKVVLKYFKQNPNDLKYFTQLNAPFDYTFELEEHKGVVTKVDFVAG